MSYPLGIGRKQKQYPTESWAVNLTRITELILALIFVASTYENQFP